MTIVELLQKVHLKYEKNTDYPAADEEDFLIRLAYADDGIDEWEKPAKDEGVAWPAIWKTASIAATGTGTDPQPTDFLNFTRAEESPAYISDGTNEWVEVSMSDGNRMAQESLSPYVFWMEAGNIRTLPAIAGTITFPYLREFTRYPLGTESDAIEVNEKYLEKYVLSLLYFDDKNMNAYQTNAQDAKDILDSEKLKIIIQTPTESDWGFGM